MRLEHPPRITGPPPTTKTKSVQSSHIITTTRAVSIRRSSSLFYRHQRDASSSLPRATVPRHIDKKQKQEEHTSKLREIPGADDDHDHPDDDNNNNNNNNNINNNNNNNSINNNGNDNDDDDDDENKVENEKEEEKEEDDDDDDYHYHNNYHGYHDDTRARNTAFNVINVDDTYQRSLSHDHESTSSPCVRQNCPYRVKCSTSRADSAKLLLLLDNTAFRHRDDKDESQTKTAESETSARSTKTNKTFGHFVRREWRKVCGENAKQKKVLEDTTANRRDCCCCCCGWLPSADKFSAKCRRETVHKRLGGNLRVGKQAKCQAKLLLLLFYLLALPLLCFTDPSASPLVNLTQRNASSVQQQHLRSVNQHQDSQQHPYNEYTWEVNQINPWLSACDLAGPAPADLQGSCGPPEVPKYCPMPCPGQSDANKIFGEVVESLDVPIKLRSGNAAKNGKWRAASTSGFTSKSSASSATMPHGRTAPDQCLFYLEESHKRDICRDNFALASPLSFLTARENRYWFVSGLRLRHCCEHAAINALAPGKGGPLQDLLNGNRKCVEALDKLLSVDALAARLHCEFEEVLARYDCSQSYSVIHNCTHCKEAYRKWVCSSLVPYFAHEGPSDLSTPGTSPLDTRLRPCRSFCQSVEQRCPYLLPGDRAPAWPTQYAGEPTFLCRDPNIPETGEQARRALHGNEEQECCFHVCSENEPGLGVCYNCTDRLSHGRRSGGDAPTAPQCVQSDSIVFIGQQNNPDSSASPAAPLSTTSASSNCGGVVLLSSSSSKTSTSAPVPLLCLLSIWAALISLCTGQTVFPWSPAMKASFVLGRSHQLSVTAGLSSATAGPRTSKNLRWSFLRSSPQKCLSSTLLIITYFKKATHQLRRLFFLEWYRWWWRAWRTISRACRSLKWYKSKTKRRVGKAARPYRPSVKCRNCLTRRKKARRRRRRFCFSPRRWKKPS